MKSFDPMNDGEEREFEDLLSEIVMRRPPVEWKAMLLPKAVPPLIPKALWLGLGGCWAATAVFLMTTSASEDLGPPVAPPSMAPSFVENALVFQTRHER